MIRNLIRIWIACLIAAGIARSGVLRSHALSLRASQTSAPIADKCRDAADTSEEVIRVIAERKKSSK